MTDLRKRIENLERKVQQLFSDLEKTKSESGKVAQDLRAMIDEEDRS